MAGAAPDYSPAALARAAGGDPWARHDLLASGSPDAILAAAAGFRRSGEHAAEAAAIGRAADLGLAVAFVSDGRPVFDASASSVRTHTLLGAGGATLEETARILIDVATALAENAGRSAARVVALDAELARIIRLRNAFFIAHAAELTPPSAAAAEQRFHGMAVDTTRAAAGAVQAEIDDYDGVLANRTARLLAMGHPAVGDPSDDPDPVDATIAEAVTVAGEIVGKLDEWGDAVVDAVAEDVLGVGTAIGGPVGGALGGVAGALGQANRVADDAVGEVGTRVGDAVGGETGGAISDVADGIAGRQSAPGTYTGGLVPVNTVDEHADRLADYLDGRSKVAFSNDPDRREFDMVSDEYVGQAKPSGTQIGGRVRDQAKATFEAALDSGRSVYYHFDGGPPHRDFVRALERYSERYGVPLIISSEPL